MSANLSLIGDLKMAFNEASDPARATGQQAYMKSMMPYYGIVMPELRRLCRSAFRARPLASNQEWRATAESLWRRAEFREERYAALELVGFRPYRQFFEPRLLELLDEFIITGAWWDYVDQIAASFVGALLAEHPQAIRPRLQAWSVDEDIWRRRSAIICQIKFKEQTDWPLLQSFILPSMAEKEFFLRKGIGWSLRAYSRTDPQAVLGFVREHRQTLSGLSKREGLKLLLKADEVTRDDVAFQTD